MLSQSQGKRQQQRKRQQRAPFLSHVVNLVAGLLSSSCCAVQLLVNLLNSLDILKNVGCAGFNSYLGPIRWQMRTLSALWLSILWTLTLRNGTRSKALARCDLCDVAHRTVSLLTDALQRLDLCLGWRKRIVVVSTLLAIFLAFLPELLHQLPHILPAIDLESLPAVAGPTTDSIDLLLHVGGMLMQLLVFDVASCTDSSALRLTITWIALPCSYRRDGL